MPRKKIVEEKVEQASANETETLAAETSTEEVVEAVVAETPTETEEVVAAETVETVPEAVEVEAAETAADSNVEVSVVATADETEKGSRGNRAQRIGLVTSDKMTNTVVVRVDRLVKHPRYRRYVRQRKKYMAHDEIGAGIGDKVKIVETRPLSARKRWRVIEIVQKAAK